MENELYKLVGHKVSAANVTKEIFKTGFLTCKAIDTGDYRIAAREDHGAEGFYFSENDVEAVRGTTIFFKPFA